MNLLYKVERLLKYPNSNIRKITANKTYLK